MTSIGTSVDDQIAKSKKLGCAGEDSVKAKAAQQTAPATATGASGGHATTAGSRVEARASVDPAAQTGARQAAASVDAARSSSLSAPPAPTAAVTPARGIAAAPVSATPAAPVSATPAAPVSATPATPVSATPAAPVSATPAAPVSATPAAAPPVDEASRDLRRGSKGDDVAALQKQLNARGAKLEEDGKFGPLTQKALKEFQRGQGLTADGVSGPRTREALKTTPTAPTAPTTPTTPTEPGGPTPNPTGAVELAPKNMTPQQKFEHYSAIVKANGGTVDPNKPTVLGIRGMDTNGNKHDTVTNKKFDDTFVILDPKTKTATEIPGTTHAAQLNGIGEGRRAGVPLVSPGSYDVKPHGQHNGMDSYQVFTKGGNPNIPAIRDGNHDGRYSAAEKARQTTAGGILFHTSPNSNVAQSAGCMSFSHDAMRRLLAAAPRGFSYTLVDANR